jgi:hypothetical protein
VSWKALDATGNPSAAGGARVTMDDDEVRLDFVAGSDLVNITYHLSRQRDNNSPEYIEISSSSSSFDSSEDEDLEQPEPRINPRVQQQLSSEVDSRRQPSSPLTPDQMADPGNPPAGPSREPGAASILGQQNPSVAHEEASANNNNFNNFDDLDIQDVELARIMEEQFRAEIAARHRDDSNQPPPGYQVDEERLAGIDLKAVCLGQVQAVFPDICIQHISVLYSTVSNQADVLVANILEAMDKGTAYPKSLDTTKRQKRKRELDEDEEAAREYSAADRPANTDTNSQRNM